MCANFYCGGVYKRWNQSKQTATFCRTKNYWKGRRTRVEPSIPTQKVINTGYWSINLLTMIKALPSSLTFGLCYPGWLISKVTLACFRFYDAFSQRCRLCPTPEWTRKACSPCQVHCQCAGYLSNFLPWWSCWQCPFHRFCGLHRIPFRHL